MREPRAGEFDTVWAEAGGIKGWFARREARLLHGLARGVAEAHCIVEIGSYLGRATVVLAASGREVVAVDPLVPGTRPTGTWEVTPAHAEVFRAVIDSHPNVTWLRMRSTECPPPAKLVGLLLIDGEHDWPEPMQDYEHFEPCLAPDATVAFHDYKVCGGVTRTVGELVEAGRIERVKVRERLFVARARGPKST